VDVLTAAAILTVYEGLPEWARREFAAEEVRDMATMAWDILRSSNDHARRAELLAGGAATERTEVVTGHRRTMVTVQLPAAPATSYLRLLSAWRATERSPASRQRARSASRGEEGDAADRGRSLAEAQALELVRDATEALSAAGPEPIAPELAADEEVWRAILAYVEEQRIAAMRARLMRADAPTLDASLESLRDGVIAAMRAAL
jgi:hypothetical protein